MERSEIEAKVRDFVREYKGYGFFSYAESPSAEEETVGGITERVLKEGQWPLDWFLLADDERDIYWFDSEWMGDLGRMYEEFLGALSKLSGGDFGPSNIEEFVDFKEDSEAWVRFDWAGRPYRIALSAGGDYIDFPGVVHYLNDTLRNMGHPHRFVHPYDTEDQTAVLAYLTDEAIQKLKSSKGWPIQEV